MDQEERRKVKKYWRTKVALTIGVIGSLCLLPFAAVESFQTYKQKPVPQGILDVQPKLELLLKNLDEPNKSITERINIVKDIENIAHDNKLGFTRISSWHISHRLILEQILSSKKNLSKDELDQLSISLDALLRHSFKYSFYQNYLSQESSWIISRILSSENLERKPKQSLEQILVQDFKTTSELYLKETLEQSLKKVFVQKNLDQSYVWALNEILDKEKSLAKDLKKRDLVKYFEQALELYLEKTLLKKNLEKEELLEFFKESLKYANDRSLALGRLLALEQFSTQLSKSSFVQYLGLDEYLDRLSKNSLMDMEDLGKDLKQALERHLKKNPNLIQALEQDLVRELVQDLISELKRDLEQDLERDFVQYLILNHNHEWDFNRDIARDFERDLKKELVQYLESDFEQDFEQNLLNQIIEIKLKLEQGKSSEILIGQLPNSITEELIKVYDLEMSQSYGVKNNEENLTIEEKQMKLTQFASLSTISALGLIVSALLLIRQRNQGVTWNMTGLCFMPEECVGELYAMYEGLQSEDKAIWTIRLIMLWNILILLKSLYIQVAIEDLLSPGKNKRD